VPAVTEPEKEAIERGKGSIPLREIRSSDHKSRQLEEANAAYDWKEVSNLPTRQRARFAPSGFDCGSSKTRDNDEHEG